jgi:hypothetical protein
VGDLIYSLAIDLGNVPVPSASDPFWLELYPCQYAALLALIRIAELRRCAPSQFDPRVVAAFERVTERGPQGAIAAATA